MTHVADTQVKGMATRTGEAAKAPAKAPAPKADDTKAGDTKAETAGDDEGTELDDEARQAAREAHLRMWPLDAAEERR